MRDPFQTCPVVYASESPWLSRFLPMPSSFSSFPCSSRELHRLSTTSSTPLSAAQ